MVRHFMVTSTGRQEIRGNVRYSSSGRESESRRETNESRILREEDYGEDMNCE